MHIGNILKGSTPPGHLYIVLKMYFVQQGLFSTTHSGLDFKILSN